MKHYTIFCFLPLLLALSNCGSGTSAPDLPMPGDTSLYTTRVNAGTGHGAYQLKPAQDGADYYTTVQAVLVDIRPGDTVVFGQGTYGFSQGLTIEGKPGLVLRGAGMESSILDFGDSDGSAEGIRANSDSLLFANLRIQDAPGDGLKVKGSKGVSLLHVAAVWTGELDSTNGAYGLYPVECEDVLIDGCYTRGASDAGIYVGQSTRAIIRNCQAEENVAGIESENSTQVDIHGNTATRNSAGILVFDLPNLMNKNGGHIRVYDNQISNNNTRNFASPGGIVAEVVPGTGLLVLASKDVEVFGNRFRANNVLPTAVMSYALLQKLDEGFQYEDPEYDPFAGRVHLHDNNYATTNEREMPATSMAMGKVLAKEYGRELPVLLIGGLFDPRHSSEKGLPKPGQGVCVKANPGLAPTGISVLANQLAGLPTDPRLFDCRLEPLAPVQLQGAPRLPDANAQAPA